LRSQVPARKSFTQVHALIQLAGLASGRVRCGPCGMAAECGRAPGTLLLPWGQRQWRSQVPASTWFTHEQLTIQFAGLAGGRVRCGPCSMAAVCGRAPGTLLLPRGRQQLRSQDPVNLRGP
jgi:hypothetical protein